MTPAITPTTPPPTPAPCARCGVQHRRWSGVARCRWPGAHRIVGTGSYAVLAKCRLQRWRVSLHATLDAGRCALSLLNAWGCGADCSQAHSLFELTVVARPPSDEPADVAPQRPKAAASAKLTPKERWARWATRKRQAQNNAI
jgi:hypothetical protein